MSDPVPPVDPLGEDVPPVAFPFVLINQDGGHASIPMTSGANGANGKKTPIFLNSKTPPGYSFTATGRGDDPSVPAIYSEDLCSFSQAGPQGNKNHTFGFMDHVYLLGGWGTWLGADVGDYLRCQLIAPASTVHEGAPGEGELGVVLSPYGGGNLLVPSQSPTHHIDPVAWPNTEMLKELVPVPSFTDEDEPQPSGWWDWDYSSGTFGPNASMEGMWHLMDFEVVMWRHLGDIPLLGAGTRAICPENLKYKKILPGWKFKATVHRELEGEVKACWNLDLARKRTTVQ